jgi:flagella basal body P-ring formation protein FlgA
MKFAIKILMAFFLVSQINAQTIMRFKPHITAEAKRLGDLVEISNDTTHLALINLDSQPRGGQRITKKQIMSWLKNKNIKVVYKWKGKKTAFIKQNTLTSGIDLVNKAQQALKNHLEKQEYSHIELISKTKLKGSALPLSAFTVEINNLYPIPKKVCVRLLAGTHSIPIWFTVKANKEVLVAQHQIKNRTEVHENDFIIQNRTIAGLKDEPLTQLPQATWIKKSINTNQILTTKFVTEMPSVIKGKPVQVTVSNHGVSILTEAIAQNDGYIGQKIRMKNSQTNKYFIAVVTATNQAEITS